MEGPKATSVEKALHRSKYGVGRAAKAWMRGEQTGVVNMTLSP